MARGTDAYAGAARLGRALARAGLTVATGGGPGAMEAANLGAYAAPFDDDDARRGLETARPRRRRSARRSPTGPAPPSTCATAGPAEATTVGIPTWFYGHEPPNVFAAHIAKYFANATREDGLLARCTPGSSSCRARRARSRRSSTTRHRTTTSRDGDPRPMVLVDRDALDRALPAWPLLRALARRPLHGVAHRTWSTPSRRSHGPWPA